MIESELIGDGVLKVIAPPKLQSGDFAELAREVEPLVRQNGSLRVIIDATHLQGWKNMSAVEEHAAFVKSHQKDVDRIAIIAGHEWHRWLVGALKVFLHPEIRVFDTETEALNWIKG